MKTKKAILIPIILSSFLLTACGDAKNEYTSYSYNAENDIALDENYDNDYSMAYEESADNEEAAGSDSETYNNSQKENNTSDAVIQKEMLVYSCNMTIDVLDFDTAINSFKQNIDVYDAFVGNENYTDGGSGNRWYDKNEERWKNLHVNYPCSKFKLFGILRCNGKFRRSSLQNS